MPLERLVEDVEGKPELLIGSRKRELELPMDTAAKGCILCSLICDKVETSHIIVAAFHPVKRRER